MRNATPVLIFLLGLSAACNTPQSSQSGTETEQTTEEIAGITKPNGINFSTTITDAKAKSPRKELKGTVGATEITINYGSPSVKGRAIWGALEPYGKIWRTGANEATIVSFSTEVKVQGQALPAGDYALFTIPSKEDWTIIFSKNPKQFGAYEYKASEDALRVKATPQQLEENVEQLEFILDNSNIVMRWEKMAVPFKVEA